MRKCLLILACAFSFCLRAETNIVVSLTPQQWALISSWLNDNGVWGATYGAWSTLSSDGSISELEGDSTGYQSQWNYWWNTKQILTILHLIMDGTLTNSYDTSENNILAYASSLRSHNESVRDYNDWMEEWIQRIDSHIEVSDINFRLFSQRFNIYADMMNAFRSDCTNNFELLYAAITNLDISASISNQIDILNDISQNFNINVGGVSNEIAKLNDDMQGRFVALDLESQIRHNELMDLLRSLTNGAFFASNLCNCCSNSNYQDSVISMLDWMTNNFPDSVESPPIGGGGDNSNDVWHVWRPDGGSVSGWNHLFVPSVKWVQDGNNSQQFKPLYDNQQYDSVYNGVWGQYADLLQEYRASGIDGQQFLAGLVDLQLHILANMSTQLYMIDSKIPSKTNLWNSINDEVNWVRDNAESVKTEVESKQYDVQSIFNNVDVSLISTYFPKVQQSISKLNTTSGDPVLRIPLPSVFGSGSASDFWVVDVREIRGYDSLRDFFRWICICIWSIILLRSFAIPVLVVVCLAARFADCSCGLLFTDTTTGCHVFGNIVGAWADFTLNLIGLDTRLKRYAVGAEAL